MEDSYVSEDSCTLIDESDIWYSSADGSVHLEVQDKSTEPSTENLSEMSLHGRLWYALRSLAVWREKARVKQKKIRLLEQNNRDLRKSRDNYKEKLAQAEDKLAQAEEQLKAHAASADQAAPTEASSKQTIIFIHDRLTPTRGAPSNTLTRLGLCSFASSW